MTESHRVHRELVRQALAGDRDSLNTLAARVQERVRAYLNRVTLDEERAQDLTQETLVSVVQSLGTLKRVERFWSWVFSIATNKARQQFRYEARHRAVQMSAIDDAHLQPSSDSTQEGFSRLSTKELGELTRAAMAQVSERYRMTLALRLFEDMPHAEVARALGCSELSARATFFRAKRALLRELRRRGVQKTAFVAALGAFGASTVSSPTWAAPVAVSASAAGETVLAGILSAKAKAAMLALAAGLAVAFAWHVGDTQVGAPPTRKAVRFVHFAHQSPWTGSEGPDPSSGSKGCYEQWYHFPEGLGGPALFRMQRWDPRQTTKWCWWVQNGDANYYIQGTKMFFIRNWRLYYSNYMTKTLPTDPGEFCEFVRQVEGERSSAMTDAAGISCQRDPETGFLASRVDRRFADVGPFETKYDYSDFDTKLFDQPAGMPVVDERDDMHRRGWTCFVIEGELAGKAVSGRGRVPFVYSTHKTHPAWLELAVNGELAAVDEGKKTWLKAVGAKGMRAYPGGSLFKGLSRPWAGFHTMDTIRRDAAAERIWFSTQVIEPHQTIEVTLVDDRTETKYALRYSVDMDDDLLGRIDFWTGRSSPFERRLGGLTFSYLSEPPEPEGGFAQPTDVRIPAGTPREKATVLWPLLLIDAGSGQEDLDATAEATGRFKKG